MPGPPPYTVAEYDLKYASLSAGSWQIQTVDSAGDVGKYCSLALGARYHGLPGISYYDKTHKTLKYAAWNGTSWDVEVVDSCGDYSSSLKINYEGKPRISYCIEYWPIGGPGSTIPKYAEWTGSNWQKFSNVYLSGGSGKESSLILDHSGNPVIGEIEADPGNPESHYGLVHMHKRLSRGNTTIGTNVRVQIGDATITFDTIISSGNTSVTKGYAGPPAPINFQASCTPPAYYNIVTSAGYQGNINICLKYNDAVCYETGLRLFHYEGNTWVDITTSVDTVANIVCGTVTSLSEFLVAFREPQSVDNFVSVSTGPVTYDQRQRQYYTNIIVKNTSARVQISEPLWLVIETISHLPDLHLTTIGANRMIALGMTSDRKPYIDLSKLLGDGKLSPGERIQKRIYLPVKPGPGFALTLSVRGVVMQ
jgi:hypothetical protein